MEELNSENLPANIETLKTKIVDFKAQEEILAQKLNSYDPEKLERCRMTLDFLKNETYYYDKTNELDYSMMEEECLHGHLSRHHQLDVGYSYRMRYLEDGRNNAARMHEILKNSNEDRQADVNYVRDYWNEFMATKEEFIRVRASSEIVESLIEEMQELENGKEAK